MLNRFASAASIAALMTFGAGVSAAHAEEGGYVRFDPGWVVGGNLELGDNNLDLDTDPFFSAGLGYGRNAWRVEGEYAYSDSDLQEGNFTSQGVMSQSFMLNGYYDFNYTGRWIPYVGAGIGAAYVDATLVGPFGNAYTSDTNFAYQLMAGIGWRVGQQAVIDLGYRFFNVPDMEGAGWACSPVTPAIVGATATCATTTDGDGTYERQGVLLGLRIQFAPPPAPPLPPAPVYTPPPPPPPPPAMCNATDFVVYFEWDRSDLNSTAMETIDAALEQAKACNLGTALVVGHTDTSGSAAYNVGLSQRRADVVRDALVSRGLPASSINAQAAGETQLAQQTRDGVREPLNRRAAVTISFQ